MVAQTSIEISCESDLEPASIMLRLKLDQVEPPFIRCELRYIGVLLNSATSPLGIPVSYRCCICFRYEGNQLIPACGVAAFDSLNTKPLGYLEDRLLIDSQFVGKFGNGNAPGRR